MNRFERVVEILDNSIGGPAAVIGVHGAFWRGKTRDEFVALEIRNRQLLIVRDGSGSNLVKALKGVAPFGADLDPPALGASLSRMPAGFDPVATEDIAFVENWIDDGCLEDDLTDTGSTMSWNPTNAPQASSRTDDIWMLSENEGWAVNSNGSIIHTDDGFDSFEVQFQDIPPAGLDPIYFRCLAVANNQRAWAGTLTAAKTLFETNDGQNWTQVAGLPALAPSAICGMFAVNDQVIYASGTNYPNRPARMMKTTDGGTTWTAWSMKTWADLLVDCYFTSETRGWVVGGKSEQTNPNRFNVKPVVLLTEDGGQTWVNTVDNSGTEFPLGEWGWKIQFLTEQIGFVSLESFNNGAILKTADGGKTWKRLPANDPQKNMNLEGVGFLDEQHGWVGGWGDANFDRKSSSETRDGGLTWQDANHIGVAINRFRFIGNPVQAGFASGKTVYKYSNRQLPLAAATESNTGESQMLTVTKRNEDKGVNLSLNVPEGTSRISIYIWDRFGEFICTLVDDNKPAAGLRKLTWDRTGVNGSLLPAGHFIIRIAVDAAVESHTFRLTE